MLNSNKIKKTKHKNCSRKVLIDNIQKKKSGPSTKEMSASPSGPIELFYDKKKQEKGFVSISLKYIYIARNKSRSYWVKQLPKISFNDNKKTLTTGKNKIYFKRLSQFELAKKFLKT